MDSELQDKLRKRRDAVDYLPNKVRSTQSRASVPARLEPAGKLQGSRSSLRKGEIHLEADWSEVPRPCVRVSKMRAPEHVLAAGQAERGKTRDRVSCETRVACEAQAPRGASSEPPRSRRVTHTGTDNELVKKLQARRSYVESAGDAWQKNPEASSADVHLRQEGDEESDLIADSVSRPRDVAFCDRPKTRTSSWTPLAWDQSGREAPRRLRSSGNLPSPFAVGSSTGRLRKSSSNVESVLQTPTVTTSSRRSTTSSHGEFSWPCEPCQASLAVRMEAEMPKFSFFPDLLEMESVTEISAVRPSPRPWQEFCDGATTWVCEVCFPCLATHLSSRGTPVLFCLGVDGDFKWCIPVPAPPAEDPSADFVWPLASFHGAALSFIGTSENVPHTLAFYFERDVLAESAPALVRFETSWDASCCAKAVARAVPGLPRVERPGAELAGVPHPMDLAKCAEDPH